MSNSQGLEVINDERLVNAIREYTEAKAATENVEQSLLRAQGELSKAVEREDAALGAGETLSPNLMDSAWHLTGSSTRRISTMASRFRSRY